MCEFCPATGSAKCCVCGYDHDPRTGWEEVGVDCPDEDDEIPICEGCGEEGNTIQTCPACKQDRDDDADRFEVGCQTWGDR